MVLLVTAASIGAAALVLALLTPVYSATALILFEPASRNVLDPDAPIAGGASENARIDSEVELLRSDAVLLRLLRDRPELVREELSGDPGWFTPSLTPAPAPLSEAQALSQTLRQLRSVISVQRRGLTYLIAVQARSASADRAAELANGLAAAHVASQLEHKIRNITAARGLIERQLGAASANRSDSDILAARARDLTLLTGLQLADSAVVSPAMPPARAAWPEKGLVLTLAAAFGLALGIAAALAIENVLGGFTSEEQLRSVLRVRTASTLPRAALQRNMVSVADLTVLEPMSAFAEAVRHLRASCDILLSRRNSSGAAVIMVTGSRQGEGASSTALALARAFSLAGQNTLLIDCNLRTPNLHVQLDLPTGSGLVDALRRAGPDIDVAKVAVGDPLTDLTILVGAGPSREPTDPLLAGPRFGRLLAAARQSCDIVLLDTPAIEDAVDALYLAPHADLVLLVARWAATSQTDAKRTLARLGEGAETPILAALTMGASSRRWRTAQPKPEPVSAAQWLAEAAQP